MGVTTKSATEKSDINIDEILKQAQPSKGGGFKSVLGAIGRGALNIAFPGLGGALGGGIAGRLLGEAMPGIGSETTQYLALQRQLQQEQIAFETVSTVLKIRADTSMTAIRNMNVK
jgi:hypothetical protein